MSESQVFQVGDRALFQNEERYWQYGIVTDVFQGPVSGVWLYVVDGTGYTENELRPVPESRKVTS